MRIPVSGERRPGSVGAAPGSDNLSSAQGVHSSAEPEDRVSITRPANDEHPEATLPTSEGALRELELRLREQTAQNSELDAEVRYLMAELAIAKEFAVALEAELELVYVQAGRNLELAAEFEVYRQRFSHRAADRLAQAIHRRPRLSRPLKVLSRAVIAVASHSDRQKQP
jgi:hypothetical protein